MRDDEEGSRLHFLAGWGGKERQSQVLSTLEQLGFEPRGYFSVVSTTVLHSLHTQRPNMSYMWVFSYGQVGSPICKAAVSLTGIRCYGFVFHMLMQMCK